MFGFFKRRSTKPKVETKPIPEYKAEFQKRVQQLQEKFAIGNTPYEELLDAMNAVDNEMNRNGGGNWNTGDYGDYLQTIERHLTADPQFSPSQIKSIGWSIDDVAACGEELSREGSSGRNIDDSLEYLIARVVDWSRTHEPEPDNES